MRGFLLSVPMYAMCITRIPCDYGSETRGGAHLLRKGIQTGVYYPVPVHLQPAYRDLGYGIGNFPAAETVAGEVLSLPLFPEMTDAQQEEVCGVFRAGLPAGAGVVV